MTAKKQAPDHLMNVVLALDRKRVYFKGQRGSASLNYMKRRFNASKAPK